MKKSQVLRFSKIYNALSDVMPNLVQIANLNIEFGKFSTQFSVDNFLFSIKTLSNSSEFVVEVYENYRKIFDKIVDDVEKIFEISTVVEVHSLYSLFEQLHEKSQKYKIKSIEPLFESLKKCDRTYHEIQSPYFHDIFRATFIVCANEITYEEDLLFRGICEQFEDYIIKSDELSDLSKRIFFKPKFKEIILEPKDFFLLGSLLLAIDASELNVDIPVFLYANDYGVIYYPDKTIYGVKFDPTNELFYMFRINNDDDEEE